MSAPKRQLSAIDAEPVSRHSGAVHSPLQVRIGKRYLSGKSSHFELEAEFEVEPGVTIIVGHSGAGKSTILRCIAGLSDPDEGRIAIDERVLFDSEQRIRVSAANRRVAFVFQDLALFPHLSVEHNVTYGLRRLNAEERNRRMHEILESFQIAHLRERLPREISGGEQQRVALARSLVTEPSVLLLDEPLSSLDPRTKDGIVEDLRRWNIEHRIPIIYVTHDHEEVLALGDRVLALEHGKIVAHGSPAHVIDGLHRATIARPSRFENIFDATVVSIREDEHTMLCRISGTSIEIETRLASVDVGAEVRFGLRASDILILSSAPTVVGSCNVISGRIRGIDRSGASLEARISCGAEFRTHLEQRAIEHSGVRPGDEVWMMFRPRSCHLVRSRVPATLKRLFVFICRGNTSRSPMAQAICNAEIARRFGVSFHSLEKLGIKAISAGLSARPGEPLSFEAGQALSALGITETEHRSGNLTYQVAQKAEVIFCMTKAQRTRLIGLFPEFSSKIKLLEPDHDIADPSGNGAAAFAELATMLSRLIGDRLNELEVVPV